MSVAFECYKLAKRAWDKLVTLLLRRGFHSFGRRSVVALPFRSGHEHLISIGNRVYVGPSSWIQVMGIGNKGIVPIISLDDDVSISGDCTITAVIRVSIGKGALIARFVHISDHSHAYSDPKRHIKLQGYSKIGAVSIGEGAWLGHGVVICPGVKIGRNAVIGANSVVLNDVPDYCVAVGAPAKVISHLAPSDSLANNSQ